MNRKKKRSNAPSASGLVKILSEKVLWDGFVRFTRVEAEVPTLAGGRAKLLREVHDHGDVAAVLPVDFERQKLLLIRQWRIPAWLNGYKERPWEVVAGIIVEGETAEACAHRETVEETGYQLETLSKIAEAFSSPGLITERVHLFLGGYHPGTKNTEGGGAKGEDEDIEVAELTFAEARRMMETGEIVDAKTLMALAALFARMADPH